MHDGACGNLIASGQYSCEDFAFGTTYAGYCNLQCAYNDYDSFAGPGSCDELVGSGTSCDGELAAGGARAGDCDFSCGHCPGSYVAPTTCAELLAAGLSCADHQWYCEFECGRCPITYTSEEPHCMASDALDEANADGQCAHLLAEGLYTCDETMSHDVMGGCMLACQMNFLDHAAAYVSWSSWSTDTFTHTMAAHLATVADFFVANPLGFDALNPAERFAACTTDLEASGLPCPSANAYDSTSEPGACASILLPIAEGGQYGFTCESHFAFGKEYAGYVSQNTPPVLFPLARIR